MDNSSLFDFFEGKGIVETTQVLFSDRLYLFMYLSKLIGVDLNIFLVLKKIKIWMKGNSFCDW